MASVFDRVVTFIESTDKEFTQSYLMGSLNINQAVASLACRKLVEKGILSYRQNGRVKIYSHSKNGETHVQNETTGNVIQTLHVPVDVQFGMISHITNMVLDGTAPSFLLTGMAGIGKTYAVRKEIETRELVKDLDYRWVSGKASPLGLYSVLHDNRTGLVVFDDCDDVLKQPGALAILKSALDLYKVRTISWPSKTVKDAGMDESFEFTGQVIFISNLDFSRIADALTSRTFKVDVNLTPEQVIEKIKMIIHDITPNGLVMSMEYKHDALSALIELKDEILAIGKNLDLRAFEKVCLLRQSAGPDNWDIVKKMIKYQI